MLFSAESTFANFLASAFSIFIFILWFWLFITAASDLFRRQDISGFGKVIWVIFLIVLPYIGIFAYILTQGGGMAERNRAQARQARDELRQVVGFSIADELTKLERLMAEKSISKEEYARLRARILQ
ncbi:MAG: PLDc N-terminal domain-containing protein [Reyranella sp.]|nr:PLDc N-terminal domain-containing protein [Reyranella sp.]